MDNTVPIHQGTGYPIGFQDVVNIDSVLIPYCALILKAIVVGSYQLTYNGAKMGYSGEALAMLTGAPSVYYSHTCPSNQVLPPALYKIILEAASKNMLMAA